MVDYDAFERAQQPLLVSTVLPQCDKRQRHHLYQLSKLFKAQANILQDNDGYQAAYQQQTQNLEVSIQLLYPIRAWMQDFQRRRSATRKSCALSSALRISRPKLTMPTQGGHHTYPSSHSHGAPTPVRSVKAFDMKHY
jgi:hypothetical protein